MSDTETQELVERIKSALFLAELDSVYKEQANTALTELTERLETAERLAEDRATYAHEQAARMGEQKEWIDRVAEESVRAAEAADTAEAQRDALREALEEARPYVFTRGVLARVDVALAASPSGAWEEKKQDLNLGGNSGELPVVEVDGA